MSSEVAPGAPVCFTPIRAARWHDADELEVDLPRSYTQMDPHSWLWVHSVAEDHEPRIVRTIFVTMASAPSSSCCRDPRCVTSAAPVCSVPDHVDLVPLRSSGASSGLPPAIKEPAAAVNWSGFRCPFFSPPTGSSLREEVSSAADRLHQQHAGRCCVVCSSVPASVARSVAPSSVCSFG